MRATAALPALLVLAACTSSHDPLPDARACAVTSDCLIVPESCCGSCGAATRGDVTAVNRPRLSDHRTDACGGTDVGCPACFMEQDPTLVATCRAGLCEVVDLHEHASARCATSADCRVRTRSCCECGGDTSAAGLVAIHVDGNGTYQDLACDAGALTPCPECAPVYPDEASATCSGGHCEVVWSGVAE